MISREGLPLALGFGLGAAAVTHGSGVAWALPLWAAFAVVVYLFYDRRCENVSQPNVIVAPADGVVTRVGEMRDSWLERDALRVRVKFRFPGITITRSPVSGKILDYLTGREPFDGPADRQTQADEGRPAGERGNRNRTDEADETDKADKDSPFLSPNAYALHVRTDEGEDVVSVVSSLLPLSRVKLDVSPGGRVGQSHRYGFVYFSDYVDLLLSPGARPEVVTGQKVRGGETLLATLPRAIAGAEQVEREDTTDG